MKRIYKYNVKSTEQKEKEIKKKHGNTLGIDKGPNVFFSTYPLACIFVMLSVSQRRY